MRRILSVFLMLSMLFSFPASASGQPDNSEVGVIESQGAILMEQSTGKILFSQDSDAKLYPASTTKVLTALLAIEYGDLQDIAVVGNEANMIARDGSKAGLKLKEEISLENLIRGLLLPSGNDAANTIAVYIGRKVSQNLDLPIQEALNKFIELMNKRARQLGATNSNFTNAHGYHDSEHYTTAHDLALIAREAMKHEFFREVAQTCLFTMEDWSEMDKENPDKKATRYWRNSNALIQENDKYYYPYATGGKTGYTSAASHCLIATASRDGLDLISVVLNSSKEGKWKDSVALFEYGFANFEHHQVVRKGEYITTLNTQGHPDDDSGRIGALIETEFSDIFKKEDIQNIDWNIKWDDSLLAPPPAETDLPQDSIYLLAPVFKNQVIGKITYTLHNQVLKEINLVASRTVNKKEDIVIEEIASPKQLSSPLSSSYPLWYWIVGGFTALFITGRIIRAVRRKRRRRYLYYRRRY